MESYQDNIEYSLKKDLLIPCWIYKVSIETSREKKLNFLEETILELTNLDESLLNDINRLSFLLGFENRDIIHSVLKRLKDLNLSDYDKDIGDSKVNVYIFYQEVYTGELLPIVTKDINKFSYPEKDKKFNENIYRQISFKQDISSKRNTEAFLVNDFSNRAIKLTREDIIKTIYLHNQKDYDNFQKIDYQNFNIDLVNTNELIYLHAKLFIPKNSIDSIVVSNGFTNDYSTLFRKIYESQHQELVYHFRDELKQGSDNNNFKVNVPFEKEIKSFPDVFNNIKSVETNLEKLKKEEDKNKVKKFKEYILTSLYDAIEKAFEVFTKELKDTDSLKNKKSLHKLAQKAGFKLETDRLPIFNVSKSNNLQKFFAKSLLYKKSELYEVALKYPNFLYTLSDLFNIRNGLKHSQKEDTLIKVEHEDIEKYIDIVYTNISLILKVKQKNIENATEENDDDIYFQNSFIDLEKELSMDVIRELPQEIKDNLISVNYYINELDFEHNKYNIVKETINQIYSSFEYIFKNIVTTLYSNTKDIKTKNEIIEKIDEKNLEISLLSVSPPNIENAQSNKNASLGAYFLVYLYYQKEIDMEMINTIQTILSKRKHSTPTVEEVEKTTKEELQKLKNNSFNYIKKLMEER
jgi:hypothetical protein